jgi:adenylyltransferase/sulfurtransferase
LVHRLNPEVKYNAHAEHLTTQNATSIVQPYDLVLDCTDHPTSRYLISDICVLLSKPLISASALKTDGQLMTLNSPSLPPGNVIGGPCYRCVFPKPPPAESVVSCGEGGILGPVVGVMGVLQALEAIKLIASGKLAIPDLKDAAERPLPNNQASMLLFSANANPPFRTIRMRGRRKDCFACSGEATLTLESMTSGRMDYVQFCGVNMPVSILEPNQRISASEYEKVRKAGIEHILLDVREKVQFEIANFDGSVNVPFSSFQGNRGGDGSAKPTWMENVREGMPIYLVCKMGNDSQVVAKKLMDMGLVEEGRWVGDIRGGLKAWREEVDESWPEY